jgi:DNA-binding transcriptional MerR regulator
LHIGRRYYRPADMQLLRQIKALLHDDGMTIRGAQLALAGKPAAVVEPPAPLPAVVPRPGPDRQALIAIRNRLAAALAA